MTYPALNVFSSTLQCLTRTKAQREFEQKLYMNGLAKTQVLVVKKLNETIPSKELAMKFILQELDVARQGDTLSQNFATQSGFHLAQYLGALDKFEEDQAEIEKIQAIFLNFLSKIANEKVMFQIAMIILDGVMEYWLLGKYDGEAVPFVEKEEISEDIVLEKPVRRSSLKPSFQNIKVAVMKKLEFTDKKIQNVLDLFKNEKEVSKPIPKIYTEEKVNDLMEEYSHVIEDIITGKVSAENAKEIAIFQTEISLAAEEGNNLASVFCTFFEPNPSFPSLPLPITTMDEKSKIFFIKILSTFEEKGFSQSLENYLYENRDNVYALATANDKFMQYLMAFWYVWENDDEEKALQDEALWYGQSASNGFKPAVQKMNEK